MSPDAERRRRETEDRLARILQRVTPTWRNRIRRAIADAGSVRDIPRSFWLGLSDTADVALAKEVAAYMAVVYEDAVESVESQKAESKGWLWKALGIGAAVAAAAAYLFGRARPAEPTPEDADPIADRRRRIEEAAADAAAARGRQIAIDYADGTRKRLEDSIDGDVETLNGMTDAEAAAEIEQRIDDATSDKSIENVVVFNTTEVTSEAQRQAARDIMRAAEQEVSELWRVEKDEQGLPDDKVCPICKPLEGTGPETWEKDFPLGPPCHLHCRCDVELVLVGGAAATQAA